MDVHSKSMVGLKSVSAAASSSCFHSSSDFCGLECTICYKDSPKVPVVTPCGHLYCWSCLHRWLSLCLSRSIKRHCPVCSATIEQKKLIYIKGGWSPFYCGRRSPFECNICLELAQAEPIITLCGHLYCRPCLDKRLHVHSNSKNSKNSNRSASCSVCNSHIVEKKLIPLYGQGIRLSQNDDSEPSSQSLRPIQIPNRPEAGHEGPKSSAIAPSTLTGNHSSWVFGYKRTLIVMLTFVGTLIGALIYVPACNAPTISNSFAAIAFSDQNSDSPT